MSLDCFDRSIEAIGTVVYTPGITIFQLSFSMAKAPMLRSSSQSALTHSCLGAPMPASVSRWLHWCEAQSSLSSPTDMHSVLHAYSHIRELWPPQKLYDLFYNHFQNIKVAQSVSRCCAYNKRSRRCSNINAKQYKAPGLHVVNSLFTLGLCRVYVKPTNWPAELVRYYCTESSWIHNERCLLAQWYRVFERYVNHGQCSRTLFLMEAAQTEDASITAIYIKVIACEVLISNLSTLFTSSGERALPSSHIWNVLQDLQNLITADCTPNVLERFNQEMANRRCSWQT